MALEYRRFGLYPEHRALGNSVGKKSNQLLLAGHHLGLTALSGLGSKFKKAGEL
jgi:hypothetical protein